MIILEGEEFSSYIINLCISKSSKYYTGQPDNGLHRGPKHVVVYYVSLLIVILLCS